MSMCKTNCKSTAFILTCSSKWKCVLCVVCRLVTALHVASEKGHGGIVELLTKHGAKVNERDHLGQTPLYVAAREGRVGVSRFLCANGAEQNIKTTSGKDVEAVSVEMS